MRLLHEGYLDGEWRGEGEMEALAIAALRGFGNGCCFYLASAIGVRTGQPIAALWRADKPDWPLVHAAVVDPSSGYAADILGLRPFNELRQELAGAVGEVRVTVESPSTEIEPGELDVLLDIAAGLPWMPSTGRRPLARQEWGDLLQRYALAREQASGAANGI